MAIYGNTIFENYNKIDLLLEFDLTDSLKNLKERIIKIFISLIDRIQRLVNKMKDGKIKSKLTSLLTRAKNGLRKSKTVENTEDVKELKQEAEEIKEEIDLINEEISGIRENPDKYNNITEEKNFIKNEKKVGKYTVFIQVEFNNKEIGDNLYELIKNMEDAETYDEYEKSRNEFRNILGIPNKTTIYGISTRTFGEKISIFIIYMKEI